MLNSNLYIVRKEFFGGVVWSSSANDYFLLSTEDIEVLEQTGQLLKDGFSIEHNFRFAPDNSSSAEFLGFPLRVHLGFVDKCNTACRHCFLLHTPKRKSSGVLSKEDIYNLIEEMALNGCMELFVGGGEPFLREDWFEIFKFAESKEIQLFIFSNGAHFDEDKIQALNSLRNIGYLSISLEGFNKETYAIIRQGGLWDKVMSGLEMLGKSANFPVYVRYTATATNVHYIKELVSLIERTGNGKIGIKIRPVLPSGAAKKNAQLLIGYKEYLQFLVKVREEIDTKIDIDSSIHKDADPRKKFFRFSRKTIGFSRFVPLYTGFGGSGGYTSLYIDPFGNIQDCVMTYGEYASDELDNIRNKGLLFQWQNAKPILQKRELKGNLECLQCEHYAWCRGGCRARAIYVNDDPNSKDPWCFKDLAESCTSNELDELLQNLNEG